MADKNTKLSIRITAVDDKATQTIKTINDRLRVLTMPLQQVRERISALGERIGSLGGGLVGGALSKAFSLFKSIGGAIGGILQSLPGIKIIGEAIGSTVSALREMIDKFDQLGDASEKIGVSADFLAQMRYAAKKSGAEVEELDSGLQAFSTSLGKARAGSGALTKFLGRVSPALLSQLKGAKSNEAAFDLMAAAMAKVTDPAKKAALATAAFGNAGLAPLFAKGPKGIAELRARYAELAGPQQDAVDAAGEFGDSMDDLDATVDGVKASLTRGLAPALKVVADRLSAWLVGHREDIAKWAKEIGDKLPGAIEKVVSAIGSAISTAREFLGELKDIVVNAKLLISGPDELKNITVEEIWQGQKGLANRRLKNALEGTEKLGRNEKLERANAMFREAAALTGGEHFSQRDQDRADALRAAGQQLRDAVAAIKPIQAHELGGVTGRAFGGNSISADAIRALSGAKAGEVAIKVDINGPPGTRARIEKANGVGEVDLSRGVQMFPGGF